MAGTVAHLHVKRKKPVQVGTLVRCRPGWLNGWLYRPAPFASTMLSLPENQPFFTLGRAPGTFCSRDPPTALRSAFLTRANPRPDARSRFPTCANAPGALRAHILTFQNVGEVSSWSDSGASKRSPDRPRAHPGIPKPSPKMVVRTSWPAEIVARLAARRFGRVQTRFPMVVRMFWRFRTKITTKPAAVHTIELAASVVLCLISRRNDQQRRRGSP